VKLILVFAITAIGFVSVSAARPTVPTAIERMPAVLETRFALSAMSPVRLKVEVESRYSNKTYKAPARAGVSYMIAPVMRTWMLPDFDVHTMPMPHLMFYAPNITNADIGAAPNANLRYPFIFKEGIAEQSYVIQLIGDAERTKIMADEKTLLTDLCAYRDLLCLPDAH
jgi:hypothetical protein